MPQSGKTRSRKIANGKSGGAVAGSRETLFNAKVFEYVFVAGMGQAAFYLLAVVRLVGVFSVSAASGRQ